MQLKLPLGTKPVPKNGGNKRRRARVKDFMNRKKYLTAILSPKRKNF